VNNLPKVVDRKREAGGRTRDLRSRKSSALTTTPPRAFLSGSFFPGCIRPYPLLSSPRCPGHHSNGNSSVYGNRKGDKTGSITAGSGGKLTSTCHCMAAYPARSLAGVDVTRGSRKCGSYTYTHDCRPDTDGLWLAVDQSQPTPTLRSLLARYLLSSCVRPSVRPSVCPSQTGITSKRPEYWTDRAGLWHGSFR